MVERDHHPVKNGAKVLASRKFSTPRYSRKKSVEYAQGAGPVIPLAIAEEQQISLIEGIGKARQGGAVPSKIPGRYHRNGTEEKIRGAVYTPPRVAASLTRWAVRSRVDKVLDPSCGEGVFLSAARTRLADLGARKPECLGVDIDSEAAAQSGAICADFFRWIGIASKFDAIIGNPPFVRSHLFPEDSRALAFDEMAKMGLRGSRLMSTWAPFLALCCKTLGEQGRLAMVIPEELLAVGYAEGLRKYLLNRFRRVIVCFPAEGIFPEVQQAVILLLCDNDSSGKSGLLTMEYSSLEEGDFEAVNPAAPWEWNGKWTHLFLSPWDRRRVVEWWLQSDWQPFYSYGRVEVGIVTGDNSFFILNREEARRFDGKHLVPIVTSAKDLRGIKFGADDFKRVLRESRPAFLINLAESKGRLSASERSYLELGEREQIPERYKCRVREPWYAVPSVWAPDGLLLRQAGEMPRLVHLTKKCTATDTIHRVTWRSPKLGRRHSVSFMNTWTLMAGELMGRSYGGGVLELMPSEANRLPMPGPSQALDEAFDAVDERVRSRNFHDAVSIVDDLVMPCWMSKEDRSAAGGILSKLISRRKVRSAAQVDVVGH
ncbi:MAG: N-6 DNA methylase [Nitrospirae bacterium]|nr:N-6 DNA methylase [Nitrospirota bacterium]